MLPVILPDPTKMYCSDKPTYCYKFHFMCTPSNLDEIHFLDNCVSYGYTIPNYKVFLVENMTLIRLGLYFIVKNGYDVDPPPEICECLKDTLHPCAYEYFHNMINILNKYIENALETEPSEVEKFNKLVDICKDEITNISNLILGLLSSNANKKRKKKSNDLGVHNDGSKKKLENKGSTDIISSRGLIDEVEDKEKFNDTSKFYFKGFYNINILENQLQDRYMCIKHYLRQRIVNEISKQLQLIHGTVSQIEIIKTKTAKDTINKIIDDTITLGKVQDMKKW